MTPARTSDRASFDPLGAGALLVGVLVASVALGALVGWLAGSPAIGVAVGAIVGMPAAVGAVIKRYRGAF